MKKLRRLADALRESPTYGRDRATLVSGFTIGGTALLLNMAVMALMAPLMFDPDDRDVRMLTENVGFGQLSAMALLGGAAAFATVLIPLRLLTVFWGPRIGRYFDQVVLSGVSPLRFVIGKAVSQNLFLGLILFLLLPYLVLSFTLGGVPVEFFLAGLFLLWLYCMALALATLWASLYLNESLATLLVMSGATASAALGCIPLPVPVFVATPFPVLVHPLHSSIPYLSDRIPQSVWPVFVACAVCMTCVIGLSLLAIHLGPLFGVIRENSTFGEVVRAGDGKRKRWFRLRPHIQRPSEIAFFYENRGNALRRHEGLIRWGGPLAGLLAVSAAAHLVFIYVVQTWLTATGGPPASWWAFDFHVTYLTIHGCGLVLGALLFSHALNTTYQRIPLVFGRTMEVSQMDTAAFLIFAAASTAAATALPYFFETHVAAPAGTTVFPEYKYSAKVGPPLDYTRVAFEGVLLITFAGIVVYAFQRFLCLTTWLKSLAFLGTSGGYLIFGCLLPALVGLVAYEAPVSREVPLIEEWAPIVAMGSSLIMMLGLFDEFPPRFPGDVSTTPFYVWHGFLLAVALIEIRRRGRKLRKLYLAAESSKETA